MHTSTTTSGTSATKRWFSSFVAFVVFATVAVAAAVPPAAAQAPDPFVDTFEFTGASQTWTVPADVFEVQVELWGGSGGGRIGGLGGYVKTRLAVLPGQTYQIRVGGEGALGAGGWNGGGAAPAEANGGGGATDMRVGAFGLSDRRLVAGGGGAAARPNQMHLGAGGSGGGFSGGDGQEGNHFLVTAMPGATQTSGRSNGVGRTAFCNGSCPGAGGGGYYGGEDGDNYRWAGVQGGGAGGSGYAAPGHTADTEMTNGIRKGNGSATITFPIPDDTPVDPPAADSLTFDFTGAPQYWVVPEGLTEINVIAQGAQGGGGDWAGAGGLTTAVMAVVPGETLQLNVGGQGGWGTGGFNGGGWVEGEGYQLGGGGGGATDIRAGGVSAHYRAVVAGGGGGAAQNAGPVYGAGGSGGGWVGGDGGLRYPSFLPPGIDPGGTQTEGYSFGLGDHGFCDEACSGGGGGGWYGGAAGDAYFWANPNGGGAGGSGHVAPSRGIGQEMVNNARSGNGELTISWPVNPEPVAPTPTSGTADFAFTGGPQYWTVPDGVNGISVVVNGASGGGTSGGHGGTTTAIVPVIPGQQLTMVVGGSGGQATGGYNGGGIGAEYEGYDSGYGGGGGSDIRLGGPTLQNRVVVAGGGGGESGAGVEGTAGGGVGGGWEGAPGEFGSHWILAEHPGGGQETGYEFARGENGFCNFACNGAGGGGWIGGFAGDHYAYSSPQSGGSGGSGWAADFTIGASLQSGTNPGDGSISIAWPAPVPVEENLGNNEYGEVVMGVQVGSGNAVESAMDFSLSTVGPALQLERTFNSMDDRVGLFGKGWSSTYEISATSGTNEVTIIWADGRREKHAQLPDGSFKGPNTFTNTLTARSGGGWDLTTRDDTVFAFDASGKLESITDSYNRALTMAYNGTQLASVTDGTSGRSLTFTSTGDRVTSVSTNAVTGDGYSGPLVFNYGYDGTSTYLEQACDPRFALNTSCTEYERDSQDRLQRVRAERGLTVRMLFYDSKDRVRTVRSGGGVWRFTYVTGFTQVLNARGFKWTYWQDAGLRTTRITDPLNKSTVYEYDKNGFRSVITDPNGARVELTYNDDGNLVQQKNAMGQSTWLEYNDDNHLIATRDARSASSADNTYATTYTVNAEGDTLTESSPGTAEYATGITKTYTYTAAGEDHGFGVVPAGLPRTAFDGLGTTTFSYDTEGDLRQVTDPAGLVTSFEHDELGREISMTETWTGGSATTTSTYDQAGNLVLSTGPATPDPTRGGIRQQQTAYLYDAESNPTRIQIRDVGVAPRITPTRSLYFRYDGLGRLWRTQDSLGNVTRKAFDFHGNVIRVIDPLDRYIRTSYDALDRPEEMVLSDFVDDPLTGSAPRTAVLKQYVYDAAGRLVIERDPSPGTGGRAGQLDPSTTPMRETIYGFDAADRQINVVQQAFDDLDGSLRSIEVVGYTLDATGNITEERFGNSQQVLQHTYDEAGMRQQSTLVMASGNRVSEYDYDAAGNLTFSGLNPVGDPVDWFTETRYTYNAASHLLSTEIENGAEDLLTTYEVDERGLTTAVTSPLGNVPGANPADYTTDYIFDEVGQIVRQIMPEVSRDTGISTTSIRPTRKYSWDAMGNLSAAIDERNRITLYAYDKLDRLKAIIHPRYTPPGGTAIVPREQYEYDKVGNLTAWTDRRGERTDYQFDMRNRVIYQQDPLITGEAARGEMFFEYDDAGNTTRMVDQVGIATSYTHDDFGRIRTQSLFERTLATSLTSTFNYDDLGNITYQQDPTGVPVTMTYNEASELESMVDVLGKSTTHSYDPAGRQVSTTDPLGRTVEVVFDQAGRPVGERQRDGVAGPVLSESYRTFDADGNVIESRDSRSADAADPTYQTTYERDALGRLLSVTEPGTDSPITTNYGYDEAGNLRHVTNGNGNRTEYVYNEWNQVERIRYPHVNGLALPDGVTATDARFRYFTYDAAGAPLTETQPGPTIITQSYDELGRLLGTSAAGEAPAASVAFDYDLVGRRTSVSHPDGPITVGYNDRGLVTSTSVPGNAATTQSSYTYDAAGRMEGRTDGAGLTTFTYDSRGLLESITDGLTNEATTIGRNDAGQQTTETYGDSGATRSYNYDAFGRMETDSLAETNGGTYAVTYGYDTDGRVTSQNIVDDENPAAGLHTYEYDASGRLTAWTDPTSTTTGYAYDAAGNRIAAGDATYTYDQRNQLKNADGTAYTWTPRGTLNSTTEGGATTDVMFDGLGRQISHGDETYTYDGLGRIATADDTADTTAFTYAGFSIDPSTVGDELYARDPFGRLAARATGGTASWVGTNPHTDATWLLDSTSGNVTNSAIYDPFGQVAGASGSVGSLGFQSDYTSAAGLVWMGARWYDPGVGSFTSRDTVFGNTMRSVSLNQYTYGWNDPVSMFDPDGRNPLSWLWGKASSGASSLGKGLSSAGRWFDRKTRSTRSSLGRWGRSLYRRASPYINKAWKIGARLAGGAAARVRAASAAVRSAARSFANSCGSTCRRVIVGAALVATAVLAPQLAGGIALGAAIGGGVGVATCGGDTGCILDSALAGGVGGAIAPGITGGARGAFRAGVAGGAMENATAQFLEGDGFNAFDLAKAGAIGGAFGAGFHGLGKLVRPNFAPIRNRASSYAGNRASSSADNFGAAGRRNADAAGAQQGRYAGRKSSCFKSFSAGTGVLMADGSMKNMADIEIGDLVLAADPETGERGEREVTHLWVHEDTLVDLTIEGHDLTTTEDHPFWNATDAEWQDAADLDGGDFLLTAEGHHLLVEGLEWSSAHVGTAYNLTVDDIHTYFVQVGDEEVLVHNCGDGTDGACNGSCGVRRNSAGRAIGPDGRFVIDPTPTTSSPTNGTLARFNRDAHYGGAQTRGPVGRSLKTAGEGTRCAGCGEVQVSGTNTQPVPEHSPSLLEHYYEHGGHAMTDAQRRAYAQSAEAFDGTLCLTCQRVQGGTMSHLSGQFAQDYGAQ